MTEDLKAALGQCFWIGLDGTTFREPSTRELFKTFQPGGIVLFLRNVESIDQVRQFTSDLQAASSIPLLMAVDQEGGVVERLHNIIGTMPPAMALTAARSKRLTRRLHTAHARILRSLGFNVNFLPVLDLALGTQDNGLGTRCFSDRPRIIVDYAREIIHAHLKSGVQISGKHFPGLGDTDRDSHLDLPTVPRPWKRLLREDLTPYKKLIKQLPFVMVNHAVYPDKNKKLPASLAPEIVTDFLLRKLAFQGLSISDDLIMGAVSNLYNLPEAAELALLAGNHLFLICRPDGVAKAFRRILSRAQRDERLATAIYRCSSRILSFKFRNLQDRMPAADLKREMKNLAICSQRICERATTLIRGGLNGKLSERMTLYLARTKWIKEAPTAMGKELAKRGYQVREYLFPVALTDSEAHHLATRSQTETNIVLVTNTNLNPGQKTLLLSLVENKKDVTVISAGYPVDQIPDEIRNVVAGYWSSPAALTAVTEVLTGERKPRGKFPLKLDSIKL